MSLIVKGGSPFIPAPEGVHNAVCVDVVDMGVISEGKYGPKHKCRLVWELEAKMESGKPFLQSKIYNLTLGERSYLHKDLKSWRGKPFTAEELEGFDIEKVLGVSCQLHILHNEEDGIIYANVMAVKRPVKILKPTGEYIRYKDRPENQIASNRQMMDSSGFQEDVKQLNNPEYGEVEPNDDVPF